MKDDAGNSLPGIAPVAMQQGRYVAKSIRSALQGKVERPFAYKDKGQMATIGRKQAVVQLHRWRLSGFPAWILWLFIHIYFLIGFKNKLFVFAQWAWSYFTFKRGARLIVDKEWRSQGSPPS